MSRVGGGLSRRYYQPAAEPFHHSPVSSPSFVQHALDAVVAAATSSLCCRAQQPDGVVERAGTRVQDAPLAAHPQNRRQRGASSNSLPTENPRRIGKARAGGGATPSEALQQCSTRPRPGHWCYALAVPRSPACRRHRHRVKAAGMRHQSPECPRTDAARSGNVVSGLTVCGRAGAAIPLFLKSFCKKRRCALKNEPANGLASS